MYRGAALNLHKYRLRASSCPDIYRNSMTTLAKENEEVEFLANYNKQLLVYLGIKHIWEYMIRETKLIELEDFLYFDLLFLEMVWRITRVAERYGWLFNVPGVALFIALTVDDLVVHLVHRALFLSRRASY